MGGLSSIYLICALKALRYYFINNVHKVFCFSDDMIDLHKSGSFTNRVIFDCKLKCLDKSRHSI